MFANKLTAFDKCDSFHNVTKFANFWKNVANSLPIVVEATSNALKKHYLCTPDLKPVLGCVDKNPGNTASRSQVDEISPLGQFKF